MEAFIVRAVERILVILVSGMSIYLGYRLFLKIPFEKDAEGTVRFPTGIEVTLSRIGPGAFFALFGSIILGVLVYKDVNYAQSVVEEPDLETVAANNTPVMTKWSGVTSVNASNLTRDQQLNRLRGYMATLSEVEVAIKKTGAGNDSPFLSASIEELRQGLMQLHWDADLGDWDRFRIWMGSADSTDSAAPHPELTKAATIYQLGK